MDQNFPTPPLPVINEHSLIIDGALKPTLYGSIPVVISKLEGIVFYPSNSYA